MIEVYVNTSEQIELRTYVSGVRVNATDVTYTVSDVGTGEYLIGTAEVGNTVTTVTGETNQNDEAVEYYAFVLPPQYTTSAQTLKVLWNYTLTINNASVTGESVDYVEVVVPYVTPGEILAEFPEFAYGGSNYKTFDELKSMERTIRHVIDTFCMQQFDKEVGVEKTVWGHNSDSLLMPRRMWQFDTLKLEDTDLTDYVEHDSDDFWSIRRAQDFDDSVKRDVENLFGRTFFKENRVYKVTGNWGWEYVPNAVNQAAKILIANAYCKEETYRQRYIDNLRAADFRIEFWYPSDLTTGIASADQLLYKYRVSNVVVI